MYAYVSRGWIHNNLFLTSHFVKIGWVFRLRCCTKYLLVKTLAETCFCQDGLNRWWQKLANPVVDWLHRSVNGLCSERWQNIYYYFCCYYFSADHGNVRLILQVVCVSAVGILQLFTSAVQRMDTQLEIALTQGFPLFGCTAALARCGLLPQTELCAVSICRSATTWAL